MFLFPIGDPEGVRYRSIPIATIALVLANVIVYAFEFLAPYPEGYERMVYALGMAPTVVHNQFGFGALSGVTSMFMHSREGLLSLHLIGNMVYLWTFGRRVEDACGPVRYMVFYFTAGLCSALLFILASGLDSPIPVIGASGAVSGVMGAYLILFPGARIRTIFWVVVPIPYPLYLRAFWFLIPWLVYQLLPAIDQLQGYGLSSVAYFGHLGGFFGALSIFLFLRRDALYRYVTGVDL
ncbi:MAG: rhomboid family intramembrane serine protease [Anaerolineae bacterium]|nr:rhomboid family intramembrane serine protease [Anaerolineae bacterium]